VQQLAWQRLIKVTIKKHLIKKFVGIIMYLEKFIKKFQFKKFIFMWKNLRYLHICIKKVWNVTQNSGEITSDENIIKFTGGDKNSKITTGEI